MSSATVLYVLERFMDNRPPKGEKGLMLSFGPGFSAQRVLLQINNNISHQILRFLC
jgi:predicted naringenin-chalcone synthase